MQIKIDIGRSRNITYIGISLGVIDSG